MQNLAEAAWSEEAGEMARLRGAQHTCLTWPRQLRRRAGWIVLVEKFKLKLPHRLYNSLGEVSNLILFIWKVWRS